MSDRLEQLLAAPTSQLREKARLFVAERRRAAQLDLLYEVSRQIAGSLDEAEILQRAVTTMVKQLGFVSAGILLPVGKDELELVAHAFTEPIGAELGFRQKIGQGVAGRAAETRASYLAPDISTDPYYFNPIGRNTGSAMAFPLLREDELLGVLYVESSLAGAIGEAEAKALETLANHITTALENSRLYARARERLREMTVLQSVSRAVTSSLDPAQILLTVMDLLRTNFGYRYLSVYLLDGAVLRLAAQAGYPEGLIIHVIPVSTGVSGRAVRTRQTQFVRDVTADPAFLRAALNIRSEICVPLVKDQSVLGTLNVESDSERSLTETDVDLLTAFASQLTVAIENARLYEEIRRRAGMLEALYSTSLDIAIPHDLTELLRTIVERAARLSKAPAGGMYLCDPVRREVRQVISYNTARDYTGTVLKYGEGAAGLVAQTGQPVRIEDYRIWPGRAAVFEQGPITAVLSVPLIWQNQVTGVIHLLHSAEGARFTQADQELLTLFASQAAIAVETAHLFDETQRRLLEQTLLYECSRDLGQVSDARVAIASVAERMVRHLGATAMCYYTYDEVAGTIRIETEYWTPQATPGERQSALGEAWPLADYPRIVTALRTRSPQILRRNDPELAPAERDMLAQWDGQMVIAVPMTLRDRVPGYFEIWDSRHDHEYGEADMRLLVAFAAQAAVAVENARLFDESRRRADEQRLLFNATRDFTAGLTEEAVLRAIIRHMLEALNVVGCTVSLWEKADDRVLTLLAFDGGANAVVDTPGTAFALADYPATRHVLERAQPLIVQAGDPAADPAERALLSQYGYGIMLMLPLVSGGQVFGLVELYRGLGEPSFSEGDVELGQNLATQAAVALANARLYVETQRRAEEQRLLFDATRDFAAGLTEDAVMRAVVRHMVNGLRVAGCAVWRWEPASDSVVTLLGYDAVSDAIFDRPGTVYALMDYPATRHVLESRQPLGVRIDDLEADPAERAWLKRFGFEAMLMLPLVAGEQVFGLLELSRPPGYPPFSEEELQLAQSLAAPAAVALENARLHTEVQALAVSDSLTGLANLGAFERALQREVSRADRYKQRLSVIILDLDDFKRYNDTYGHPAGNERLKALATMLNRNVRDPDLAARYGGEEFAVLLPYTAKSGALALAERIRAAAESAAPDPRPPGAVVSGYTISLGVASFPADAQTPEALLLAADNAELAAKRAGKNRVVAAPGKGQS